MNLLEKESLMCSEACLWRVPSAWPGSHLPWKGRPRSGSCVSAFLALPGTWLSQERFWSPRDPAADAPSRLLKLILSPVCPWQAHKSFLCGNF